MRKNDSKLSKKLQKKFAYLIVIEGEGASEAYRHVYPEEAKGKTALDISRLASSKARTVEVKKEMARLQEIAKETLALKVNKEILLEDIHRVIEAAKQDLTYEIPLDDGSIRTVLNTKAATVLIKAVERASKMIGADDPEKTDSSVLITFDGELDKYAD